MFCSDGNSLRSAGERLPRAGRGGGRRAARRCQHGRAVDQRDPHPGAAGPSALQPGGGGPGAQVSLPLRNVKCPV